jgi:hypothetical protein
MPLAICAALSAHCWMKQMTWQGIIASHARTTLTILSGVIFVISPNPAAKSRVLSNLSRTSSHL